VLKLDAQRWRQLASVNDQVNALPYVADVDRYARAEFWTEIDQLGGDCEDFALEKRRRLLALGWPIETLRVAECLVETGERHAVLTVDAGGGTYVLDNRCAEVSTWTILSRRGYRWLRRQAAGGPGWVDLADAG